MQDDDIYSLICRLQRIYDMFNEAQTFLLWLLTLQEDSHEGF